MRLDGAIAGWVSSGAVETRRINRLIEVLGLLGARGRTVEEVAGILSVSPRTIQRDLEVLREAGADVRMSVRRKTWRVVGRKPRMAHRFSLSETLALSALIARLSRQGRVPFAAEAWRALRRVEAALPAHLRAETTRKHRGLLIDAAAK